MDFEKFKAKIIVQGIITELENLLIIKVEDFAKWESFKSFIVLILNKIDNISVILKEFNIPKEEIFISIDGLTEKYTFSEKNKKSLGETCFISLIQFEISYQLIKYKLFEDENVRKQNTLKLTKNIEKLCIFLDQKQESLIFLEYFELLINLSFFNKILPFLENTLEDLLIKLEKEEILQTIKEKIFISKRNYSLELLSKNQSNLLKGINYNQIKQRSRRCSSIDEPNANNFQGNFTKKNKNIKEIVFSSNFNKSENNLFNKGKGYLDFYFKNKNNSMLIEQIDEYSNCKRENILPSSEKTISNNFQIQKVENINISNTPVYSSNSLLKNSSGNSTKNLYDSRKQFISNFTNSFTPNDFSIQSNDEILKDVESMSQLSNSNFYSQNFTKAKICPLKLLEDRRKNKNQESNSSSQMNYNENKNNESINSNTINYYSTVKLNKKQSNDVKFPIFKQKKRLSAKKDKMLEIEKIFAKQNNLYNESHVNPQTNEYKKKMLLNNKRIYNTREKTSPPKYYETKINNMSNQFFTSPNKTLNTDAETITKTEKNKINLRENSNEDILAEMTPDVDRFDQSTPIEKSRKNLLTIFQQVKTNF